MKPIRGDRQIMVAVGQALRTEAAAGLTVQTGHAHQLANPLAATGLAVFLQPDADAGTAVSLAAFPVGLRDQRQQRGIGLGTNPRFTIRPRMIATARDVQRRTQLLNGVFGVHGFYPSKPLAGGSEIMPKVFFRMSRCCTIRCSSRCNRRFSAWSCSNVPAT